MRWKGKVTWVERVRGRWEGSRKGWGWCEGYDLNHMLVQRDMLLVNECTAGLSHEVEKLDHGFILANEMGWPKNQLLLRRQESSSNPRTLSYSWPCSGCLSLALLPRQFHQ